MSARFDPITGRYLHVDIDGVAHRVYVEEAGAGIPLLCLHTAGSDTRQFRGVMNDARVRERFRVIAFDMPEHPLRFRAAIGLQSGAHVDPYYDVSWLHRPDVHGGEVCAGVVSGLIGPNAPEAERWETLWHYMQGGPGVFKGDLYFYKIDGDIREQIAAIDTMKCPLYLLSGEYDYSCTPAETLDVARRVKGAQATIMSGLGHFPMSEDPQRFLTHLHPVLDQISGR